MPGHANTASTKTAPENSTGRDRPSKVITGISAFRATCRRVTCHGDSPFACAVCTNGWLRTSRIAPRAKRAVPPTPMRVSVRSEEHTSELQSPCNLVCRLLLEKKKKKQQLIVLCTDILELVV